jgi:hypothetical protein
LVGRIRNFSFRTFADPLKLPLPSTRVTTKSSSDTVGQDVGATNIVGRRVDGDALGTRDGRTVDGRCDGLTDGNRLGLDDVGDCVRRNGFLAGCLLRGCCDGLLDEGTAVGDKLGDNVGPEGATEGLSVGPEGANDGASVVGHIVGNSDGLDVFTVPLNAVGDALGLPDGSLDGNGVKSAGDTSRYTPLRPCQSSSPLTNKSA